MLLLTIFALFGLMEVSAQSTVYFFLKDVGNAEIKMLKDGSELPDMRGPVISVAPIVATDGSKTTYTSYSPSYRKCSFKSGATAKFQLNYDFTIAYTGEVVHL